MGLTQAQRNEVDRARECLRTALDDLDSIANGLEPGEILEDWLGTAQANAGAAEGIIGAVRAAVVNPMYPVAGDAR